MGTEGAILQSFLINKAGGVLTWESGAQRTYLNSRRSLNELTGIPFVLCWVVIGCVSSSEVGNRRNCASPAMQIADKSGETFRMNLAKRRYVECAHDESSRRRIYSSFFVQLFERTPDHTDPMPLPNRLSPTDVLPLWTDCLPVPQSVLKPTLVRRVLLSWLDHHNNHRPVMKKEHAVRASLGSEGREQRAKRTNKGKAFSLLVPKQLPCFSNAINQCRSRFVGRQRSFIDIEVLLQPSDFAQDIPKRKERKPKR